MSACTIHVVSARCRHCGARFVEMVGLLFHAAHRFPDAQIAPRRANADRDGRRYQPELNVSRRPAGDVNAARRNHRTAAGPEPR